MPPRPPTRTPTSTLCRVRSKCYHRQMFAEITGAFVLKNLPESEVELVGEVPYDALASYREAALKHIAGHLELPGFRPGKVPAEMALKKVEIGRASCRERV